MCVMSINDEVSLIHANLLIVGVISFSLSPCIVAWEIEMPKSYPRDLGNGDYPSPMATFGTN